MTLKYKQLEPLLVEAFTKKAPSQNVPTEITDKIMMYYYHSIHRENFPIDLVIDQAFLWASVQRCDPENTCQTLLKCNCCKRHQKQKGNVHTSDKTGELEIKEESIAKTALRHLIIGGELNPFRKSLFLRGGFNFQRRLDMSLSTYPSLVGFSWGIGLKVSKFRLDYSRASYHLSGAPNYFSIAANLSTFGI